MKKKILCALVLLLALVSCSVTEPETEAAGAETQPALPLSVSEAASSPRRDEPPEEYRSGINPGVAAAIESFVEESRKFRSVPVSEKEEETPETCSYSAEELEILALIVYQEAGGNACSDDTRMMVASVFLNRVEHPEYPDSFKEVALEKGQYGSLYWTGLEWPARASADCERAAVERAYTIAERALKGERVLPGDVIFQSEFVMGEIVAQSDGMYFCKEA